MSHAQIGDRVSVYYKGILDDGTIAEGTAEGDPYEFTVGDEAVKRIFTAPRARHGRRRVAHGRPVSGRGVWARTIRIL